MHDIRWEQRFNNYKKALARLSQAIEVVSDEENLTNSATAIVLKSGLIQTFEFTMELSWNVMKDYLTDDGVKNILGSKDAIRHSFSYGLIEDAQQWIDMLKDRNLISHTYDEEVADKLANDIINKYHSLFVALAKKMEERL
ncbi:MAG: nucleotidyltransferase substrate binding protein [Chitinivibrionia bacterium]|nr:nucleotidyltransferase substrate binding protein [Chitinivibrionia bacterium]